MKAGDAVRVHNLNGETARGEIYRVTAVTVEEVNADWMDADGATLADYWRGYGVDEDDPIVKVRLGNSKKVYDYPASRVEVLDGDE